MAKVSSNADGLYRRREDSQFRNGPGNVTKVNETQGERLSEINEELETEVFESGFGSYDLYKGSNVWVMTAEVVYGKSLFLMCIHGIFVVART